MRLRIEARAAVPGWLLWLTPILSLVCTLLAAALLFTVLGKPPGDTLRAIFLTPLLSMQGLSELALKASPLLLIAVGLAAGFRAGVWNIGAEGQLVMGAVAGGGVALATYGSTSAWVLPAMVLAGLAGGMAWAAVPAFLRTRFGVNEILVSLMLTYVAGLFLSWLVLGPWKDPEGMNFPQSRMFDDAALLPKLVEGTRLDIGILVALAVAGVASFVLRRTVTGLQIRTVGEAPAAARYAGFSENGTVWATLLVSGGLAGLAGVFEVAGPIGQLIPKLTPGYGFTAIVVAFLGRLQPVRIVLAAGVVALSYIGGDNAQVELGLPNAAVGLVQALLLFFLLASDVLLRFRIRVLA
ncbi:MAG: ABC transporter permease [Janthinobacterium lividum]